MIGYGFGAEFVFSDHGKEQIVGEIFVRVFNEQPAFPLEVRVGLSVALSSCFSISGFELF